MARESTFTNMVVTLFAVCLVAAAVLGGLYALTKEPIEAAQTAKINAAIGGVVPEFDNAPSAEKFTVEANGMYAEAIGEMLMQYHHEVLRLFPAIPKEWGCGCSFRGFAIDANTHISASVCDGVIECEITVDTERELQIEAFGVVHTVKLCAGKNSFRFAGKSAGV